MSYPPFQYRIKPFRFHQPGYYDPYSYPDTPEMQHSVKGRYGTADLPGREHPLKSCDMSESKHGEEVQKYFWGPDAYDLPVYDPSVDAKTIKYRDAMILGKFNAGGKFDDRHLKPFIYYKLNPDSTYQEINNNMNMTHAPYPAMEPVEIRCEKEGFLNFTKLYNILIVVVAVLLLLVIIKNLIKKK